MFNLAVPRATPSLPSYSPNFPRASTTRYTHAKHGSILYFLVALNCSLLGERQLISEVDIFDLGWRLWGYFLPYYSHIYFLFWPPTCLICLIWPRSLKLNYEFPNSSSPIPVPQFLLLHFVYFIFIFALLLWNQLSPCYAKMWSWGFSCSIIQTRRGHLDQLAWSNILKIRVGP